MAVVISAPVVISLGVVIAIPVAIACAVHALFLSQMNTALGVFQFVQRHIEPHAINEQLNDTHRLVRRIALAFITGYAAGFIGQIERMSRFLAVCVLAPVVIAISVVAASIFATYIAAQAVFQGFKLGFNSTDRVITWHVQPIVLPEPRDHLGIAFM